MIRRSLVISLEIVLVVLFGLVVIGGILAAKLNQGPLEVELLRPRVEKMLSDANLGLVTDVEKTAIVWQGWRDAVDLVAYRVVVRDGSGVIRARISEATVEISVAALLQGVFAPVEIKIARPSLLLVRTETGQWQLSPDGAEDAEAFDLKTMLLDLKDDGPSGSPLSFLRRVEIVDGSTQIVDRVMAKETRVRALNIAIQKFPDRFEAIVDGFLNWQNHSETKVALFSRINPATEDVQTSLTIDQLPFAVLRDYAPELKALEGTETQISATAELTTSLAGALRGVSGEIDLSVGALGLPDLYKSPLAMRSGQVRFQLSPKNDKLVAKAALDLQMAEIEATAELSMKQPLTLEGAAASIAAEARKVDVSKLSTSWPEPIAPSAREWVTGNVTQGHVSRATLNVEARLGEDRVENAILQSLDGEMWFEGGEVHYFRPLPPIQNIKGSATYNLAEFSISVAEGTAFGLKVDRSTVLLNNLDRGDGETAIIDAAVRGPVKDALAILSSKPLEYPQRLGIDTEKVQGVAGTRLRFNIPLLKDLDVDEIELSAVSKMTGVVFPKAVGKGDLTEADLDLELNKAGMTLSGTGKVLDQPARVSLDQRFHTRGSYTSRSRLESTLTAGHLATLGLNLTDYVSGPVGVVAELERRADKTGTARVAANLNRAEIVFSPIAWQKPRGMSAAVSLVAELKADTPHTLRELQLTADNLVASGLVRLDADGAPNFVALDSFRHMDSDARGTVSRTADGGWALDIKGRQINLVPIIEAESNGEPAPSLTAKVETDRLMVTEKLEITGVRASYQEVSGILTEMALTGSHGRGEMSVSVTPENNRRVMRFRADDAGAALRAFDVFDSVEGGVLRAAGYVTGKDLTESLRLLTRIDEFALVDAPSFAQVLSLASITGLTDAIDGRGVRFARASGGILKDGPNVTIRDGVAYGPGLGLKMAGDFNTETGAIDIEGLVAPAYSLSRLIDRIPIIGELLTGGEGEGLLATGYRMTGSIKEPVVRVNPLTALAPGFVRGLLREASNEDENGALILDENLPPPPQKDGPGK